MKKNFKKLSVAAVIFALFTAVMSFQIFASTDVITVFVDGEQINFDVDPVTENDRTLVPMRAIFEALGATVTWDETTQTAIAVKDVNTIKITIDSNIMYKNEAVSYTHLDVYKRQLYTCISVTIVFFISYKS